MEKAIFIGFEALVGAGCAAGTVAIASSAPWPLALMALFPAGGCVLIGLIIFDIART